MTTRKSIYDVWKLDMPGSFDKKKAKEILSKRWGVNERNVINRLERAFSEAIKEANFISRAFGICYNDKGEFFFDKEMYDKAQEIDEAEFAKKVGLTK